MIFSSASYAGTSAEKKGHPKVALVLSGGGAKGFAHIGVLKVLEEEGIPVDLIVGTSIGSLIGGFYSLGYSASEIEGIAKNMDWKTTLSDDVPRLFLSKNDKAFKQRYMLPLSFNDKKNHTLPKGLINSQNVMNLLCGLAGNIPENADFLKFPIPFACVATDLETGDEVVMTDGFLPTAMYASMAIPGAFQPAERHGRVLVDGGVVNNFPTDVAKKMGADIIIGVDIRGDFFNRDQMKSMSEIFGNLINFYGKGKDSINNSLCDIIVRPDVSGYSIASFSAETADSLIPRGERAILTFSAQLRDLKQKYNLQTPSAKVRMVADKWHISKISFEGSEGLSNDFLQEKLHLSIPGNYSYNELKNSIDRLYGTGGFNKIYFSLNNNENGKTLVLKITPKQERTLRVGFTANTTDAATLMLNATQKNYKSLVGLLSVSAELSANPGLSILTETKKKNLPAFGVEIKGKFQNYGVFEKGDKIYDADLFYTSGSIYMNHSFLKQCEVGFGLQEEYFDGDVFTKRTNSDISSTQTNYWLTNAYAYFSMDNMDHFYFPTKGTDLFVEFSADTELKNSADISPSLLVKMRNVLPLGKNTALLLDFYSRFLFNSNFSNVKTTLVGGEAYSQYFNYHFPFVGLPPVVLANRYVYIGLVGLRFQLHKSHYLSLVFNSLQQNVKPTSLNNSQAVYGGGIKYSMKTAVGPIDIGLGYSDTHRKPTFAANLGYWF